MVSPHRNRRRVFISATTAGFGEWRKRIKNILLAHDIMPVEQEAFQPCSEDLLREISNEIFEADGVICLIGPFYGFPSPEKRDEYRMSYTQYEWFHTRYLRRPCLTFIAERAFFNRPDVRWPESNDDQACQEQFVEVVKKHGFAGRYGIRQVASELALALELSKINWVKWLGDDSEA